MGAVPVLLHGASGRMGSAVRACLDEVRDVALVACVSLEGRPEGSCPPGCPWVAAADLEEQLAADAWPRNAVVIDVSLAAGTKTLLDALERHPRALVAATTGLDADDEARIASFAARAAVLRAPNLSLGNALVQGWLRSLAPGARAAFAVDIVEHHHAGKRDAPSGTALALARTLKAGGAPGIREPVLHSIRGGTVPGVHRVVLSGMGETLEIVHTVYDRAVFARAALEAARFLHGKAPGRYTVEQMLDAIH